MAWIILYTRENFEGRSLHVYTSIPHLSTYGFDDEVMSITVREGVWMVYQNAEYGGNSGEGDMALIYPGEYPNMDTVHGNEGNEGRLNSNSMSSLRPMPETGLVLFNGSWGRGDLWYIHDEFSDPRLSNTNFNDKASSAYVATSELSSAAPIPSNWLVFEDSDCRGDSQQLGSNPKFYPSFDPKGGVGNDSISSVKAENR